MHIIHDTQNRTFSKPLAENPMPITFVELYSGFIQFYQSPNCDDPKSPGTITNYKKKFCKICGWLEKEGLAHLPAENFTVSIAKRYYRELLAGYGRNYAARCTKIAGQVLEWGISEEIVKTNPLFFFKLKRDNKRKIIHLTPDELAEIESWQFRSALLTRVRDLFLWSCYTGMDYGDTMAVTRDHLFKNPKDERLYIIKPRNKVGQAAMIPYFDKTRALWEKYFFQLPKINNGTYNRILQEVLYVCGIEKKVSTHTGRKTFAMIKLNNEGYSVAAVSAMLGHKSIRTTEEYYAQVNIDVVSNELNRINAA